MRGAASAGAAAARRANATTSGRGAMATFRAGGWPMNEGCRESRARGVPAGRPHDE
jgi:hypothetical protein